MTIEYSDLNFVLVGPGKTGSTWLAQCLREHPRVFLTGETNFLTHYRDRGWDYWRRNFKAQSTEPCVGEHANWYASFESIPRDLHSLNPSLKILFCIRNPVKRAISAYKHDLRWGHLARHVPLWMAIGEDLFKNRYILPGRYSTHVRRYLEFFPPEQIYLFSAPGEGRSVSDRLTDLFAFLGVEKATVPSLEVRINEGRQPLVPLMHRAAVYCENPILRTAARLLDPLNTLFGSLFIADPVSGEEEESLRKIYEGESTLLEDTMREFNLQGATNTEYWSASA